MSADDKGGYVVRWTYGQVSRDILEPKSRKLRRIYYACSTLLAQVSWVQLIGMRGLFFVCDLPNVALYNNFMWKNWPAGTDLNSAKNSASSLCLRSWLSLHNPAKIPRSPKKRLIKKLFKRARSRLYLGLR